ncbi:hypothetical protein HNQ07_001606 [Deinococcus metalli]|uniref:Uncharacterized protein n=1 Tax=Deinococcus metalli TaxID=1141878 RepID=A0A7W8KDG2_9DEIO|nr:hypothetical protein [Deinococcus metalli]MBB5376149.1 hypothetical protein [Deinococcus metalli]GHF40433.1 hypothetical protein GCM10017781_16320 [Deinococcus metalli]
MGEGKPQTVSTPETMATHTGSDTATHGANTNLDANTQGGPQSGADRSATHEVERQHEPADEPG